MPIERAEDLRNTVLNAPIGICILDAGTLVSEIVNDKFLEVAGKPYGEIAGKFYWDSFAEARIYYETALNKVVQDGEAYYANEVELMLIRNGQEEMVFVTFVYSPIKDTEGKVVKVAVWVLENTTQVIERQRVELANRELERAQAALQKTFLQLEESEIALRLAIEAANFGTWYIPLGNEGLHCRCAAEGALRLLPGRYYYDRRCAGPDQRGLQGARGLHLGKRHLQRRGL